MKIRCVEEEFDIKKIQKWEGKFLFFNPEYVLNENHLRFALWHAKKAFKNGTNIARNLQIEFLIRLSGRKQIKKALELMPQRNYCICILEGTLEEFSKLTGVKTMKESFPRTEERLSILKRIFNIGNEEEDLEKGIFERIAMTDI
jgi:tRNA threonylcarbamoyladenosine modification (KEOPS) complex Cgi121 subunit